MSAVIVDRMLLMWLVCCAFRNHQYHYKPPIDLGAGWMFRQLNHRYCEYIIESFDEILNKNKNK